MVAEGEAATCVQKAFENIVSFRVISFADMNFDVHLAIAKDLALIMGDVFSEENKRLISHVADVRAMHKAFKSV